MPEIEVRRRADGSWMVVAPDGTARVAHAVTDAAGVVWVFVDGEVVTVAAAEGRRTRAHAASHGDLEAPMPAQVVAVLVTAGDEVAAGTPLVLLEAMKMELPLRAPVAGQVRAVHCAVGDRVAPGRPLVEVAPRAGDA